MIRIVLYKEIAAESLHNGKDLRYLESMKVKIYINEKGIIIRGNLCKQNSK